MRFFISHSFKLILFASLLSVQLSFAQTARKPSFYENKKQTQIRPTDKTSQSFRLLPPVSTQTSVKTKTLSLDKIKAKNDFDLLSRVYQTGTPFEIPHLLFVIDRKNKNKIYYVNTPKYELHETFVASLLGKPLVREELNKNYYNAYRRFIFGTLSWQNNLKGYTYEFWEGDRLTPELLSLAEKKVNTSFFAPVRFKSNSTWHEAVGKKLKLNYVTQEALIKELNLMVLNTGSAQGRLVLVESDEDLDKVSEHDIILLKDVPIAIPPVAAVITEKPSTVLSHVNVLAKGWGIPNIYLKDAEKILSPLIGQNVVMQITPNNYQIELAPTDLKQPIKRPKAPMVLPRPNVSDAKLRVLNQLKVEDSLYCGPKAANLGQIHNKLPSLYVPDGFCIPFAQYHQFMKQHKLAEILNEMEGQPEFKNNSAFRKKSLEALREKIISWAVDPKIVGEWASQWQTQLKGEGVFVRSSSNSEDLPNFSGAGLYTTIPNVKSAGALEEAVKRSWASVFNFEAYEARRVAQMPQDSVMMSTFVQTAINADSSGVLITTDPFEATDLDASYIVAKRGIGIRVVEGKRVAEQIMYLHFSKAIQILSRSDEDVALQLDDNGGVQEIPLNGDRVVLTDELVVRLANVGQEIRRLFRYKEQDIEWAVKDGKIIILQARPYIVR